MLSHTLSAQLQKSKQSRKKAVQKLQGNIFATTCACAKCTALSHAVGQLASQTVSQIDLTINSSKQQASKHFFQTSNAVDSRHTKSEKIFHISNCRCNSTTAQQHTEAKPPQNSTCRISTPVIVCWCQWLAVVVRALNRRTKHKSKSIK